MPIYEYRCKNGHTLELMQRMGDDPLSSCTTCEAPVQRVFHPVAVHFKGSGFYSTDYGRNSKGGEDSKSTTDKTPKGDGESKGESGSKAASKSSNDSKPAG